MCNGRVCRLIKVTFAAEAALIFWPVRYSVQIAAFLSTLRCADQVWRRQLSMIFRWPPFVYLVFFLLLSADNGRKLFGPGAVCRDRKRRVISLFLGYEVLIRAAASNGQPSFARFYFAFAFVWGRRLFSISPSVWLQKQHSCTID